LALIRSEYLTATLLQMKEMNSQVKLQASLAVANIKQCRASTSDDALLTAFFAPPSYGKFDVQPLPATRLLMLRDK
jgi:hypothetical protein